MTKTPYFDTYEKLKPGNIWTYKGVFQPLDGARKIRIVRHYSSPSKSYVVVRMFEVYNNLCIDSGYEECLATRLILRHYRHDSK